MKLGGREIVFALLWPLKRRGICSVSFFDWGVGKKKKKKKGLDNTISAFHHPWRTSSRGRLEREKKKEATCMD